MRHKWLRCLQGLGSGYRLGNAELPGDVEFVYGHAVRCPVRRSVVDLNNKSKYEVGVWYLFIMFF